MFGLDLIKKLKPAIYKYNDKLPHADVPRELKHFGVIAQDVAELLPVDEFAAVRKDKQGYMMVDYSQFIAPLIKAVQEISAENEELKRRIKDLERLVPYKAPDESHG